ncbi:MAG: type II toxin-antitoxin system VapC family toxin [Spirochaetes bacterium]|nr:type II toxin-antitoxin system VapC family toxin [Spirochaetota bacterium]
MIVVDTNVIGYLFLSSEQSQLSEQAFIKDNEWYAPLLWRSELRNVLSLYLRKKILLLSQANQIMNNALELLKEREYKVSSSAVLKLANESNCSAYDCEFVSTAIGLQIPLITSDKQLLKKFPDVTKSLKSFCD